MTYKNYNIDYNIYNQKEYSIQFCGDDIIFKTLKDAIDFIEKNESKK